MCECEYQQEKIFTNVKNFVKGDKMMSIGVEKLVASNFQEFKSVHVKGLRLINQDFVPKNSAYPKISSSKILEGDNVSAECSVKRFADGARFEVYRMKDAVLKFVKNKFGELKAFKFESSSDSGIMSKEDLIENTKLSFASKVRNFFD